MDAQNPQDATRDPAMPPTTHPTDDAASNPTHDSAATHGDIGIQDATGDSPHHGTQHGPHDRADAAPIQSHPPRNAPPASKHAQEPELDQNVTHNPADDAARAPDSNMNHSAVTHAASSPGQPPSGRLTRRARTAAALRPLLMPLVAGVLSALALPPIHALPVLLLTFPMLMRAIDRAPTARGAALRGFIFGLGLNTAGLYWITNAILVRADVFWWFVPLASPGCALILAPFIAVPAALCRILPAGWSRAVLLAGLWTLFDMGRIFLFSGFPWNPLGSAWAIPGGLGDVMLQPAAWIGVDGLTLLTVLLALLMPRGRVPALAGCAVLLLWAAAGEARLRMVMPVAPASGSPQPPIVVLVQGNVPEREKINPQAPREIFQRYLHLTADGVAKAIALSRTAQGPAQPVVYAWPESAFPALLQEEPVAREMIARAATGAEGGIIGSVREGPDRHWRNSAFALGDDGHITGIYDKARLVPFGEYQPPHIPLQIVPGGGMTPGPGPVSWHLPGISAVGPLICYEVIFSGHMVDRKDRPDWLVNITNDAWYGNSAGPRQHLSSVRLRAVEEGLPIARAANTGISIGYDGHGHELGRLGWNKQDTLIVTLPPPLPATLFSRFGQDIPLVLALLTIVFGFVSTKLSFKRYIKS